MVSSPSSTGCLLLFRWSYIKHLACGNGRMVYAGEDDYDMGGYVWGGVIDRSTAFYGGLDVARMDHCSDYIWLLWRYSLHFITSLLFLLASIYRISYSDPHPELNQLICDTGHKHLSYHLKLSGDRCMFCVQTYLCIYTEQRKCSVHNCAIVHFNSDNTE